MFKGSIPVGTKVEATLALDAACSGSAIILIGWGSAAGGASDGVIVAPGASATVSVTPKKRGILRVLVDMSEEADTGRLGVIPATPPEPISGDTTWGYVVG
jgi:hypothetical protein